MMQHQKPNDLSHRDDYHDQAVIHAKDKHAKLRHRKGWKGFVWGYKKWCEVVDVLWDTIKWGTPEESGAKTIVKDDFHNKTIYKF